MLDNQQRRARVQALSISECHADRSERHECPSEALARSVVSGLARWSFAQLIRRVLSLYRIANGLPRDRQVVSRLILLRSAVVGSWSGWKNGSNFSVMERAFGHPPVCARDARARACVRVTRA